MKLNSFCYCVAGERKLDKAVMLSEVYRMRHTEEKSVIDAAYTSRVDPAVRLKSCAFQHVVERGEMPARIKAAAGAVLTIEGRWSSTDNPVLASELNNEMDINPQSGG
jgi:hypothetical protein